MKEMVSDCILPKERYLKEMNALKKEAITETTVDDGAADEEEVEKFRLNLKKSVVISLGGNPTNNKKSNFSQ